MIIYKDKAFCGSDVATHTCGRELTEADKEGAAQIGLPIAYGDFCTKSFTERVAQW